MKSLLKEIESKFKVLEQDQDSDGDKDFADVMIARMMKSGMSREDAIKKVKEKQYNEQVKSGKISTKDPREAERLPKQGIDVELKDEVDETSTSAATPGYMTPNAFSKKAKKRDYGTGVEESINKPSTWVHGKYQSPEDEEEEYTDKFPFAMNDKTWQHNEYQYPSKDLRHTPGTANKTTKQKKYSGVAEAMDKKYEALIESYKEFAIGNGKTSPDKKVKETIKEVSKKLQEIEQLVQYSSRLKTEAGLARDGYGPAVNKALTKISERLVRISERVRSLGA